MSFRRRLERRGSTPCRHKRPDLDTINDRMLRRLEGTRVHGDQNEIILLNEYGDCFVMDAAEARVALGAFRTPDMFDEIQRDRAKYPGTVPVISFIHDSAARQVLASISYKPVRPLSAGGVA